LVDDSLTAGCPTRRESKDACKPETRLENAIKFQ